MSASPLTPAVHLVLDVIGGPDAGRQFRYEGYGTYIIGRAGDPDANLQCPTDARMSRRHAELSFTPLGVRVGSVTATNPVLKDGAPVQDSEVTPGDELVMGATRFRLALPSAADAPRLSRLPRRQISEFKIVGEIGRGAIGAVYEAEDLVTGEAVALKRFEPDLSWSGEGATVLGAAKEKAVAYFRREVDLAAGLAHPHIVRTMGVGREREELFLVLELIEGMTLAEHVQMSGVLAPADAIDMAAQVLSALGHAHERRTIHRDVCPSNVMFDGEGDERVAKLADFGIGKSTVESASAELTRTGEARGKGQFMAPECLADAKRATAAADIFGLGAVLYYALTGQPWFGGGRAQWWKAVSQGGEAMVPLDETAPGTPAGLVDVIRRALSLDPADRFASAGEMRSALLAVRDTLDGER